MLGLERYKLFILKLHLFNQVRYFLNYFHILSAKDSQYLKIFFKSILFILFCEINKLFLANRINNDNAQSSVNIREYLLIIYLCIYSSLCNHPYIRNCLIYLMYLIIILSVSSLDIILA
jgi:hypothetical protein